MDLLQLRYFCDAARTQNFSQTAAKFYVPPSNISQMIKRLERELGVKLFERTGNSVSLSEAGRRFYTRAAVALSYLDEAVTDAANHERVSGDVKLLILCNRGLVTKAIEAFKTEHPNVNFILRHEKDPDFNFDILISDRRIGDFLEHKLLVEEDILLAVSRNHPLAAKDIITPKDLHRERFITMPRGRSLYELTYDICREYGFLPNITIQTDDPYYVRKYVELGLGIAFVPSVSWDGLFSHDAVLKQIGDHRRKTYVYLPRAKMLKGAVAAFIRYL